MQRSGSKGVKLNIDQNLGGKNDYYYYYNNNMSKTQLIECLQANPTDRFCSAQKMGYCVKYASRPAH